MNTLVPEREIPSHQGPDAQTVDPELDVITDNQAIVIPETIDAIRALTGIVEDADESIAKTNAALSLATVLL